MTYDLIIIGGGPAGAAAGVYAARKKLKTLFLTYDFGGQSMVSADIQNWIGTKSISGEELAKQLKDHLLSYRGEDLEIKEGEKATDLTKDGQNFMLTVESGQTFVTKAVLIATGASRRKLVVPGATQFEQKGITYCATCDGPLFSGQAVVVIGGGNAGFETAAQLLAYCSHVTLLHHSAEFRADAITVEKVRSNPKVTLLTNVETIEVKGEKFVKSLVYKNKLTDETVELLVGGVFVEIGLVPNTAWAKTVVALDGYNKIKVDPKTQASQTPGIWAAGDCTDGLYHQNNIAAGDAIKAIENIYAYLHTR